MLFTYPAFLWALSLLSIPVLIHLFNFRRYRKVWFTNVRFLKEITEETTSRSRLKHLLVLLCRMMAVALLVLGFAQPYLPARQQEALQPNRIVSVFIDNSFSMEAQGRNGTLSESAKQSAREILKAYKPSDRFQILTNDFEGRHQRTVNREEALLLIDEIKTSPSAKKFSEVLKRQQQAAAGTSASVTSYLISDMQKWQADIQDMKPDSLIRVFFVPVETRSSANLAIDSCILNVPLLQPGKPVELSAIIHNYSDEPVDQLPVKLTVNGIQKAVVNISLNANSATEAVLAFTPSEAGVIQGEISISDHPVIFDDKWYFSVQAADHVSVLAISRHSPNRFIRSVFDSDSFFRFNWQSSSQADYGSFGNHQAIIISDLPELTSGLANELIKYLDAGGCVILFPDSVSETESYNYFLRKASADIFEQPVDGDLRADRINYEADVLKGIFDLKVHKDKNIDFPVVKKYFRQSSFSRTAKENILLLQNGASLVSLYFSGKGKLYVFSQAASLSAGNLVSHALFAPMLYRMALRMAAVNPLYHLIGSESVYRLTAAGQQGDAVYRLENPQRGVELIPPFKSAAGTDMLNLTGLISQAGFYTLMSENKKADVLAFNYDRRESFLSYLSARDLQSEIENSRLTNLSVIAEAPAGYTHAILAQSRGIQLWKWFIAGALLFLAAEILLLRFMK